MLSTFLKAKLHMASVTQAELWYDGSCAIDADLLKISGMQEFEQIDIYNVTNGERFTTYIIVAEAGSGIISINGAAARKCQVGDRIIIATYGQLDPRKLRNTSPSWSISMKTIQLSAQPILSPPSWPSNQSLIKAICRGNWIFR